MSEVNRSMRDLSREHFSSNQGSTLDAINCGSLARIADSIEKLALNNVQLINERDRYKKWYEDERISCQNLRKEIINIKRNATRWKNEIRRLKSGKEITSSTRQIISIKQ